MRALFRRLLLFVSAHICREAGAKVVFYHDAGTRYTPMGTPTHLFWSHMDFLLKARCNGQSHAVAFDDGFRGVWDERDGFRERGIRPMVFIAVALVGCPGYLTWDEIRTLQNEYGFDFQCHTWSHQTLIGPLNADLPAPAAPDFRTDSWYHHELADSKAEIEKQLGKTVSALCFPVGYFSDDVIRRCVAAGYRELYASFPGNCPPPLKLIPRILCQSLSLAEFKLALAGGMNMFQRRYLRRHYCK